MRESLDEAYADEEKARRSHILEVARRAHEIVGGGLSREEARSLVAVLAYHDWEFPDGFVTNDDRQYETELWAIDAAYIGASLAADPDLEPIEIKTDLSDGDAARMRAIHTDFFARFKQAAKTGS